MPTAGTIRLDPDASGTAVLVVLPVEPADVVDLAELVDLDAAGERDVAAMSDGTS